MTNFGRFGEMCHVYHYTVLTYGDTVSPVTF